MIEIKKVSKVYNTKSTQVNALSNITIRIEKGEFVALTGPSGSGKSTLLHILGGLDVPTEGEIFVHGKNLGELNDNQISEYRASEVGFIFQAFNLIPVLNVEENIVLPCRIANKKVDEKFKGELIELLGLTDRLKHLPSELSGGQQQRVAIARALLSKPSMILADEPTGNLDSNNSEEVVHLLKTISDTYEKTIVIVTHDWNIALKTNRIIQLKDGEVVKDEVMRK